MRRLKTPLRAGTSGKKSVSSAIVGALFIAFILMISSGCKNNKPVKIGFVGGLTGRLSELGIDARDGALLAVEERNKAGGVNGGPIILSVKNDEQDREKALRVDKELIREGVAAIIGHTTSAMSIAAVPVMNEARVLMVSPTSSTNKLTGLDDYFIRLVSPWKDATIHLARHAFERAGLRKINILYDLSNAEYTRMVHDTFRSEFTKLSGHIVCSKTYTSGSEIDYMALADSLRACEPDGILIVGGAMDTAMICQHVRKQDAHVAFLSSGWAGKKQLIEYGGAAVEGIVFVNYWDMDSRNPAFVAFKKRFRERFHRDPTFPSMFAYESAQVIFRALTQIDDPSHLKKKIIEIGEFKGLQETIVFDQYGDPQRTPLLFTIENRRIIRMEQP